MFKASRDREHGFFHNACTACRYLSDRGDPEAIIDVSRNAPKYARHVVDSE